MAFTKGNNYGKGRPKGSKNRSSIEYKSLYEDIIGTFKSGKHYVYYHICNDEIVYIGKGKGSRAWSGSGRKEEHKNALNKNEIEVRIVSAFLSEDEALCIERELIKIKKPVFNIVHSN